MSEIGFAERLRRSTVARHYGNSLPIWQNELYRWHIGKCQSSYTAKVDNEAKAMADTVRANGFVLINDAIAPELAKRMSNNISELIARDPEQKHKGRTAHLQYRVADPLTVLGVEVLDLFRGKADGVIRSYLNSYYKLHSIACYRSIPAKDPDGAWLWHSDNYPPGVKKIMLYLTDCDPERGSTSFINPSSTAALRKAGYYGIYPSERREDLSSLASGAGFNVEPQWPSIDAGSAIFFDNNSFHRANIPRTGYRDVTTFTVMPSTEPWDVVLKAKGINSLRAERSMYPHRP